MTPLARFLQFRLDAEPAFSRSLPGPGEVLRQLLVAYGAVDHAFIEAVSRHPWCRHLSAEICRGISGFLAEQDASLALVPSELRALVLLSWPGVAASDWHRGLVGALVRAVALPDGLRWEDLVRDGNVPLGTIAVLVAVHDQRVHGREVGSCREWLPLLDAPSTGGQDEVRERVCHCIRRLGASAEGREAFEVRATVRRICRSRDLPAVEELTRWFRDRGGVMAPSE